MSFALIGHPVASSPSPAMHRAAFRALGMPHRYVTERVTRAELTAALPGLVARFAGLNVTTPLKRAIVPLLDEVTPGAAEAGSVNTVVVRGGRTAGHSTDGQGFLDALHASGAPLPAETLILGAGGAARAVAHALREAGCPVTVWGRRRDEAARLAADLGVRAVEDPADVPRAGLLVNATPVGGTVPGDPVPSHVALPPVVFDLVIRPRRTALLRRAQDQGRLTIEGLEMLVRQGARSSALWTGVTPPLDVMRDAAARALAAPAEVGA